MKSSNGAQSAHSSLHDPGVKREIQRRMNRVAGQMAAIQRMVEEEIYCIDILQQISAVRGALRTVATRLLEAHVDHCVYDAVASGTEKERRTKVDELLEVFRRSIR
jgi:DNA-binding FrmR family transcriptional regulator